MTTIADTRSVFQRWLHLPDTGALDAVLGSVAANRMRGEAVWLLLVGPPGGGKSEILNSISALEDAHPAGTLTEASLLSGTPKRDHADQAKGGLLRNIGDFGIIVAKDFGSVLSMNRDARAQLLAALREVYDGAWTRHVGTDGGKTLSWKGKVGMVGGVTPTIDRHHAVMGAMGERFVLYRLPEVDPATQARQALSHSGREVQMRSELSEAVHRLLDQAAATPRTLNEEEVDRMIALATLVVRARSAVERDGYSREIELVPGPEAPTRLIIALDRILAGLDVIGCDREHAWAVVSKCALDSIPALRLAVLYALMDGQADTNNISGKVRHPAQTTRRALEDLVAHGLVELERQGEGKAHMWSLSSFTSARMQVFPEMSGNVLTVPETLRGVNGVPSTSSCKPLEEQIGNANNQHDLQTDLNASLDDEDRELLSRYGLIPDATLETVPPADLHHQEPT
jgi:energy-coupling factor transporter ATP-binding protein EcfA2